MIKQLSIVLIFSLATCATPRLALGPEVRHPYPAPHLKPVRSHDASTIQRPS